MFNFGNQEPLNLEVPVEKLDLFIDRCKDEKGYNLRILASEIQRYLASTGMHNILEDHVYNLIMQRIQARFNGGEK